MGTPAGHPPTGDHHRRGARHDVHGSVARAWHNQLLDQIGLAVEQVEAGGNGKGLRTRMTLDWTVPFGVPRLPITTVPCALSDLRYPDNIQEHRQ